MIEKGIVPVVVGGLGNRMFIVAASYVAHNQEIKQKKIISLKYINDFPYDRFQDICIFIVRRIK